MGSGTRWIPGPVIGRERSGAGLILRSIRCSVAAPSTPATFPRNVRKRSFVGIVEDRRWRAIFDHDTVVHKNDPVGDITGETHLVGDDNHCHPMDSASCFITPRPHPQVPGRGPRSPHRTASPWDSSPTHAQWRPVVAGHLRTGLDRNLFFPPNPTRSSRTLIASASAFFSPRTLVGPNATFFNADMWGKRLNSGKPSRFRRRFWRSPSRELLCVCPSFPITDHFAIYVNRSLPDSSREN